MKKYIFIALSFILASMLLYGCASTMGALANPDAITPQQELAWGNQGVAQVEKEKQIINDPEVSAYIQKLGDKLVANSDRKYPYKFTFKVIKDDTLNAFALPGGFIYVHSGLIAKIDNEAQLASVIGHEIGHVTYRHAASRISAAQNYNMIATVGVLVAESSGNKVSSSVKQGINLFGVGSILAYGREQEAQADSIGLITLYNANYNVNEMVAMFGKLKELEKGKKPSDLDRMLSDHPLSDDRINDTKNAIAKLAPQVKPVTNTKEFSAFKARVVQLSKVKPPVNQ